MKALSILQPWAWLIVHGHKDIENRSWGTAFRGPFLIHTGKTYSDDDHDGYREYLRDDFGIELPAFRDMPLGGIVGQAEITDCTRRHSSRWKDEDSWGFVITNAKPLPLRPYRGQLGFFEVADAEIIAATPAQTKLL